MKQHHEIRNAAGELHHVIEISGEPADGYQDQGIIWINFKLCSVITGASEPEFAIRNDCSAIERLTTNVEEATPDWTGYVKWDGCNEFHYEGDSPHGCDGIEGLRGRHALEETCLRLAHAAMRESGANMEWETPSRVNEARGAVPISCSERMPAEGVDVLIFVYSKRWTVAQWQTDAASLPANETDKGAAWVSMESDRCGDPLGFLPSDVSHWCEMPPSPIGSTGTEE